MNHLDAKGLDTGWQTMEQSLARLIGYVDGNVALSAKAKA